MDDREYQRLKQRIEMLRLGNLDPVLTDLIRRIRPSSLGVTSLQSCVQKHYDDLAKDYDITGMINVPQSFLPPGFGVALQERTGAVLNISDSANAAIIGPPGSGKTTLKQWGILSAITNGKTVIIMDGKRDDRCFLTMFPFTSMERWDKSLLEKPSWKTIDQFIDDQVEWFCLCFYGGEQQRGVLRKGLSTAFSAKNNPSWQDVHKIIDELSTKRDLFQWQQACLWLSQKIHKIRTRYPVAYASNAPGHIAALKNNLYVPLETSDQTGEWLSMTILDHVFQRAKESGDRSPRRAGVCLPVLG